MKNKLRLFCKYLTLINKNPFFILKLHEIIKETVKNKYKNL